MTLNFVEAVRLIKKSGYFQSEWYLQAYPDVALLEIDPAEHYLKYGAALGRDPSEEFDTSFYLETHVEAARSGLNPLLHYVLHGRAMRLARRGKDQDPIRQARSNINTVRTKLTSLGFTDRPLEELDKLLRTSPDAVARAMAAWELALWSMRAKTEDGYCTALGHIAAARLNAPNLDLRCRLATLELLCHHLLAQGAQGEAAYERAALAGEMTPDAMLAWASFQTTLTTKVAWVNEALRQYNIPPVSLRDDEALPAYDRLQSAKPMRAVTDGPKVTVLIAAYDSAATISTSLRSLQEQTWKNLEVIVIDDRSPTDDTCIVVRRFAESDARIRLIEMKTNGGAYVARNHGLDHATGTYVTLHDADDWSHPAKIETQIRYLERMQDVIGCTSEQARATNDLAFTRLNGGGSLINENVSSFMWRREPVREALGYWDTVRFSADNELIRRIRHVFGREAVQRLAGALLSFQRDSHTSVMADDVMGMSGFYHGPRREYRDAQNHFHKSGASLKYDGDPARRPFPVPAMMRPERKSLMADRHFDLVLAGDFRVSDENLATLIEQVRALRAGGQRVGLVEVFLYHNPAAGKLTHMHAHLRAEVDGDMVQVLVHGDKVTCDKLVVVTPGCDLRDNRYAPEVTVRPRQLNEPPSTIPPHGG